MTCVGGLPAGGGMAVGCPGCRANRDERDFWHLRGLVCGQLHSNRNDSKNLEDMVRIRLYAEEETRDQIYLCRYSPLTGRSPLTLFARQNVARVVAVSCSERPVGYAAYDYRCAGSWAEAGMTVGSLAPPEAARRRRELT